MTFDYKIEKKSGINVFLLKGELIDKALASGMLVEIDNLIENKENKLILNLSELKYINSSGLNILINILTKSRKSGGEVVITNVSKKVNELLLMTKLNTVFIVTDSVEDAVAKLK